MISLGLGENHALDVPGLSREDADLEARELLGEGGMGRVLLARQRSLQRDVAVKLLKQESATPRVIQALLQEALITGALEHPSIIPVHALGLDRAGMPLLVMKRVDGVCWRDVLRDPTHPAWTRLTEPSGDRLVASLEVLMAVCNAVHFAHSRGVVHRDIKPENVMLGSFGEVYLVDWGIALQMEGVGAPSFVGTPGYMAPEMLDGRPERVSPLTDVYLLGATLHELLTGRFRHDAATLPEAMTLAYESAPFSYPPGVPEELAQLANLACSREPSLRPGSAEVFRHRLADWLRHRGAAELAHETSRRARALDELALHAAGNDHAARRAFDRLASGCQVAFLESLRQWPGNPMAREGLRGCLRRMISVELARSNVEGACSLLDELRELNASGSPGTPGEPEGEEARLEVELRRVQEALRVKAEEADRARAVLHERDERVSSRERAIFLSALGVLLFVIGIALQVRGGLRTMSLKSAFLVGVFGLCFMSAVALVLRKKLVANEFNRNVMALALVGMVAMVMHRGMALLRGEQNLAFVLSDDLWLATSLATLAAFTIKSWFGLVAVLCAITAIAIPFAPGDATILFTVGPGTAVLLGSWLHHRDQQRAAKSDPPTGSVG
jgi:serine/threonine-protein kinase